MEIALEGLNIQIQDTNSSGPPDAKLASEAYYPLLYVRLSLAQVNYDAKS